MARPGLHRPLQIYYYLKPGPMRLFLFLLGTSVSESASLGRPAAAAIRRQLHTESYTAHGANGYCQAPRPFLPALCTPRFPHPTTPSTRFSTLSPTVCLNRLQSTKAMSSSSTSPADAGSAGAADKTPESAGKAPEQPGDDAAAAADVQEGAEVEAAEAEEPILPPLTPAQFREYNRMAEHMDHFVSAGWLA